MSKTEEIEDKDWWFEIKWKKFWNDNTSICLVIWYLLYYFFLYSTSTMWDSILFYKKKCQNS